MKIFLSFIFFFLTLTHQYVLLGYVLILSLIFARLNISRIGANYDTLMFLIPWIFIARFSDSISYFIFLYIAIIFLAKREIKFRFIAQRDILFLILLITSLWAYLFYHQPTYLKYVEMILFFYMLKGRVSNIGLLNFIISFIVSYLAVLEFLPDRYMNEEIWIEPGYLGLMSAFCYLALFYGKEFRLDSLIISKRLKRLLLVICYLLILLSTSKTTFLVFHALLLIYSWKYFFQLSNLIPFFILSLVLVIAVDVVELLNSSEYGKLFDSTRNVTNRTSGRLDMYRVYFTYFSNGELFDILFGLDPASLKDWFMVWSPMTPNVGSSLVGDRLDIHSQYLNWLVGMGLILGGFCIIMLLRIKSLVAFRGGRHMLDLILIFITTGMLTNPMFSVVLSSIFLQESFGSALNSEEVKIHE